VLVYTSARVAIFAVTLAVLYAAGMRQLLLLLVAVLVSGLLSYLLLSRQRDAMSRAVVERGEGLRQRMRERTEAEDAADDAMRSGGSGQGEPDPDQDRER
jgi:cell division protein FtsW (lipid II flippase)